MNRREFLRTAGGSATAVAAASGSVAAQEGGGGAKEVAVGPGGALKFDPEELEIKPGTKVTWKWESDGHNVVPEKTPSGASWSGHQPLENTGFTYSHTFDKKGKYEYFCEPHKSAGMVGSIKVTKNPSTGAGSKKLHELGVPIQAHWVGSATILGILVSIVYTFYVLKYGESPNTGTGER